MDYGLEVSRMRLAQSVGEATTLFHRPECIHNPPVWLTYAFAFGVDLATGKDRH